MFKINIISLPILFLSMFLACHESQAYDRTVDSFSGSETINSNNIGKSSGDDEHKLEIVFSKILQKNNVMSKERTLSEFVINERIGEVEGLLNKSRTTCITGDCDKINAAFIYLSQAKSELEKKNFGSADYFEWKARETCRAIRSAVYTLTLKTTDVKCWYYSHDKFRFKTDNISDIHELTILNTEHWHNNNNHKSSVVISVPNNTIELIRKSSLLTCQVYSNTIDQPSTFSTFTINSSVLDDWKKVITAE